VKIANFSIYVIRWNYAWNAK